MELTRDLRTKIGLDPTVYFSYLFDIDAKIKIEKRTVTSIFSLLGDIGGLYEVLMTLGAIFIGSVSTRAYLIDQLSKFYKENSEKEIED